MKTGTVLKMALSLTLLALFASCAPTSTQDSTGYQNSEATQSGIIGGVLADIDFAKANGIVAIYDAAKGGLCTGSLITSNLVITAGHCVNTAHPEVMLVIFTPKISDAIAQDDQGLRYNKNLVRFASKTIRHERYSIGTIADGKSKNDIALIRLKDAAPADYKLATLAPAQLARTLRLGSSVTLAGYGVSEYKADPVTGRPVISKGSGLLRKVDNIKIKAMMTTGEEITFDQSQGGGACHGDSGGPAYYTDSISKKTYVLGVTSRGPGNCDRLAIYTGVMGYEQWIAANSKVILQ